MVEAKAAPTPGSATIWLIASRPRTLSLSLAPVAVAAALAFAAAGDLRWGPVLIAALASALIQIATNLHNDAADFLRGADGRGRVGPQRVCAEGLIDAATVENGAKLCFAGAAVCGLYLVLVGGWPILVGGALSIFCGWLYSSGPRPIAASPFGELFVFAFFGLFAVCGAYWLAIGRFDPAALVAGAALGLFAAAVLLVNNHRDRAEDARNGRRTLAIVLGPRATGGAYALLMLAPYLLLIPMALLLPGRPVWTALAAAPFSAALVARFPREPPGPRFNAILARTAQVQAFFALLICFGALA
ncbi:1,4-dihydroxy-2-naphthoate octaprenyltransferase [Rhodoblastus sp.]|uniref:1,4-dihydroxy-2-naphthoate octaprenyltransferase n=1 Tax=Rhodoblastus sp. TaxID=1962975 RepID=UPI003F9E4E08